MGEMAEEMGAYAGDIQKAVAKEAYDDALKGLKKMEDAIYELQERVYGEFSSRHEAAGEVLREYRPGRQTRKR